jgi:ADP-ribose pyrophosphatase YjhB (NUDIX family)
MVQTDDANPFYLTQPARRSGAGVLITDPEDRILLVEPSYKPQWEVPGGIVERGEDPRTACARECREEIGLDGITGRLLVVAHQTDPLPRGDSIMFTYDGGVLHDTSVIRLQADELLSWQFVAADDLETRTTPRLASRMRASLQARREGITIEMVNGEVVR